MEFNLIEKCMNYEIKILVTYLKIRDWFWNLVERENFVSILLGNKLKKLEKKLVIFGGGATLCPGGANSATENLKKIMLEKGFDSWPKILSKNRQLPLGYTTICVLFSPLK